MLNSMYSIKYFFLVQFIFIGFKINKKCKIRIFENETLLLKNLLT